MWIAQKIKMKFGDYNRFKIVDKREFKTRKEAEEFTAKNKGYQIVYVEYIDLES